MSRMMFVPIVALLVSAGAFAAKPKPAVTLLSGPWTGHSLCVDKVKHPACKDEVTVYRFVPSGPHAAIVYADKIIAGKREAMGAIAMQLGDDERTATAHFTWGNGSGICAFSMTSDTTLKGTLHDDIGDSLVRKIDAHRVADKDLPAAPPLADYGAPH